MISDIDLVRTLISIQSGGLDRGFSYPVDAIMPTFFTPGFIASWNYAMGYSAMTNVMDGDPITLFQSVSGLSLIGTPSSIVTSSTTTTVSAVIQVVQDGTSIQQQPVTFFMLLVNKSWLVDDIDANQTVTDPNGNPYRIPTLKNYFSNITTYI